MTFHDSPWLSMTLHDTPWLSMTLHDTPWHSTTFYDTPWHSFALYWYLWYSLTFRDIFRFIIKTSPMTLYDTRLHSFTLVCTHFSKNLKYSWTRFDNNGTGNCLKKSPGLLEHTVIPHFHSLTLVSTHLHYVLRERQCVNFYKMST